MYNIVILPQHQTVNYTIIHNVDIAQATYRFYIILNTFYKFDGIPYYKNIICSALYLVLSFVEI
jgi:hypothetical protein